MQFLVIGYDGGDDEALQRRLRVRQAHIDLGDELVASGNMLYGVAILDHDQRMIGSMLVVDFLLVPSWTPGLKSSRMSPAGCGSWSA